MVRIIQVRVRHLTRFHQLLVRTRENALVGYSFSQDRLKVAGLEQFIRPSIGLDWIGLGSGLGSGLE